MNLSFVLCAFVTFVQQANAEGGAAPPIYRQSRGSPDGIGKFYQGREIAAVMGFEGAAWLERPSRADEERPDLLVEELHLQSGMTIADIGAGSGYLSRRMAPLVQSGSVFAVDVQPEMVMLLTQLSHQPGFKNIVPIQGTEDDVQLPPASIDVAVFAQLLKLQTANLQSEHASRLHFLQGQAREVDIRRLGLKLRVGFQLILALLATAVAVGLVIMVRDAFTSRSVVIEPIDVAPNLSAQVPSGKILAASLLDVLTKIQVANHSGAERRALSNGWTSEISIEVPETGISFSQLERILKTRFGHDQHIDGDLIQTAPGGLALTVRGTGILPRTFTDEGRNLDKLLLDAGEYVYGQSQPGLWTSYLANNDRADDAIRFAQSAYATVDASERPFVLNYWASAIGAKGGPAAMAEALLLYRETIRLKPDYYVGYNNIMFALQALGREEEEVKVGEQLRKAAGGRPGKAPEEMYQNYDAVVWDLPAGHAEILAELELHGGVGSTNSENGSENLAIASVEAQMHDDEAASFRLKTTSIDPHNEPDNAIAAMDRAYIEEDTEDRKAASEDWDSFAHIYRGSIEFSTNNSPLICFSAVTYELTAQSAKADAALDAVGDSHFVDCYRFRGDVLELRGDWVGAQDWYAKAVQLGPSLPAGHYSWGVALAKHGDLAGAAAKLKDANQRGPHWADPLKAWGDVLTKQGLRKDALAKYDEALKYAPSWKQLKEAREAALRKS